MKQFFAVWLDWKILCSYFSFDSSLCVFELDLFMAAPLPWQQLFSFLSASALTKQVQQQIQMSPLRMFMVDTVKGWITCFSLHTYTVMCLFWWNHHSSTHTHTHTHTWMFSIKPLRVLSPPHEVFASNDHKVVVQYSLVKSLEEKTMSNKMPQRHCRFLSNS